MTRIALITLLSTLALAGCGADGEPTRPTVDANVGVNSAGNVRVGAGVGTRVGPLNVRVGL